MKDRRLYALVVIGALLRFAFITKQSFWYDETVTVDLAHQALWKVALGRLHDLGNPPLHALLLGIWARVFGWSDASLRAMSAFFGVLTIPVLYALGRRLVGERAAFIAAALLTFSPFHLYYSQEARTYTLLPLVTLLGSYALYRALETPTKRWWALYALMTFAGAYTHYFAFMLAIGQALYVVVAYRKNLRVLLCFACAALAAGALYAVIWMPALVSQMTSKGNLARSADSWYEHLAAAPLVYGVGTTLVWKGLTGVARFALAGLALLSLVVAALAGMFAIDKKQRPFLLVWILSPIVIPLVISLTLFAFFNVRYGSIAMPPYLLLVGAGLAEMRRRRARLLAVPLAAAILVSLATYYTTPLKHDFRGAVAFVEAQIEPDDVIVFDADFHEIAYRYYAKVDVPRLRLLPTAHPGRVEGALLPLDPQMDLTDTITAHRRVWLVQCDPLPVVEAQLRALLSDRTAAVHGHVHGIDITRFDKQ